jgi:hypothetical protein
MEVLVRKRLQNYYSKLFAAAATSHPKKEAENKDFSY